MNEINHTKTSCNRVFQIQTRLLRKINRFNHLTIITNHHLNEINEDEFDYHDQQKTNIQKFIDEQINIDIFFFKFLLFGNSRTFVSDVISTFNLIISFISISEIA